jgi:hypothetical protein
VRAEKKEEIWANYSVLMSYEIVAEEVEVQAQQLMVVE